jgi:hypothetical protein
MRTSRLAVAAVVITTSGVLVAGVVGSGFEWSRSSDDLERALTQSSPTRVSDIPAADGLPLRGVFAQVTSTGQFCLFDAPLDAPRTGGGGCNAADDPLGRSVISASLAYDGGPSLEAVRDARLIGLAAANIASVEIHMSDGSFRAVKLRNSTVGDRSLQVFGFRVRKADLKKGIGPVAVVALDASGSELGRQTTGIG